MKSHTTLEKKVCPITGKTWETGTLLIDKKLKDRFEMYTVTGFQICPEAQKEIDKGFIAFVEIDDKKSDFNADGSLSAQNAYRLGRVVYLKKRAVKQLFDNAPVNRLFVFCDSGTIDYLQGVHDNIAEKKNG